MEVDKIRVRACVCVVSVIVKCPVLPPSVVDGRSRNLLYYYYYYHADTDLFQPLHSAGMGRTIVEWG